MFETKNSDVFPDRNESQTPAKHMKDFGVIPCFKRAYEIIYNKETSCLECNCGKWNRTRIPCRHLSAVIHDCEFLRNMYTNGFPLTSIGVRWMNPYYYYGRSDNSEHISIQNRIRDLILHDSEGMYCPREIPHEDDYPYNFEMEKLFNAPARERVLNYTQGQMNIACPIAATGIDIAMLSQESFFNNADEHPFFEMADPDDSIADRLKKLFFEASEAIHNSGENCLEREFAQYMNEVIIRARKNNDGGVVGKRVSMMPSNNKRRKTHGTAHYK